LQLFAALLQDFAKHSNGNILKKMLASLTITLLLL
jgi:hypothetical protein